MTPPRLRLIGGCGLFAEVSVDLRPGDRVAVGRSRGADLSAAKTPVAIAIGRDSLERNPSFRRMSRRHFEVVFETPERVVIRNLSRNGLRVDGLRIVELTLDPALLATRAAVLRFGAGEELRLEVVDAGRR